MFVAVEFQNMRSRCLPELEKLLENLSIPIPDWSGDEYRIYQELDEELMKKICALMKSSSVIEGYTKLLKLGGVAYDYSETDNELLNKIVSNGDKILDAVRKANEKYNTWQAEWGNVSPAPERVETFKIEVDTARPFRNPKPTSRLQEAWNYIKNYLPAGNRQSDYRVAYEDINSYVNDKRTPGTLLELDGHFVSVENLNEWIKQNSNYNETKIFCLKVTKGVEYREKKIPPAPPKPAFAFSEAEDALKILIQVNDIIKKI